MSLESLKKVEIAEAKAKEAIERAHQEALNILAGAESEAHKILDTAAKTAEVQAKALLSKAEEDGAGKIEGIIKKSNEDCTALTRAAEERLAKAAAFIVKKVVEA